MVERPDARVLSVGLSSRNEVTLGGCVVLSPATSATVETSGTGAVFQLLDVFGFPCGGVRPVRVLGFDAAGGVLRHAVRMTGPDGVVEITAAEGEARVAVWLANDALIQSETLA